MFRAFSFVLALILCTSVWSTARAASPAVEREVQALIAKAWESSQKASAASRVSTAYKLDPQSQTSSWDAAVKRAAGLTSDLESIVSSVSKIVTKPIVAASKIMTVTCPLIGQCREKAKQEVVSIASSISSKDEHRE
ncbi:hypothetical protein RAD16_27565 [Bradyrhizobium sp. 18BD]